MQNDYLYFDIAATTPIDESVSEHMHQINKNVYGNPSSIHQVGQKAHNIVSRSRKKIANILNCKESEIYFTSGGSESNNIVLQGMLKAGDHFITSAYEHPAISNVAKALEEKNIEVTYVKPNSKGIIEPKIIAEHIKNNTKMVSIMYANNEIGSTNPLNEIIKICKSKNIITHTDAVQYVGKKNINISELDIDLLSIGAHKFYGPKGIGALYIKSGLLVDPLILGGGQEKGISPGTENVSLISGMAYALEIAYDNMDNNTKHILEMEKLFFSLIDKTKIKYTLNGKNRLPGFINITFFNFDGYSLLLNLDMKNIAISFGSACSSGSAKASGALLSIGMDQKTAKNTVRISIGKFISKSDIKKLVESITEIIQA